MSNLTAAAEAIAQMAEKYSAIVDVADVLKNLGSLEQATAERKAAYENAVKQHEDLVARIKDGEADLAATLADIDNRQKAAKAAAENTIASANAEAEEIKADARAAADTVVASAKSDAASVAARSNTTLSELNSKIESARTELLGLQRAAANAKDDLASTQSAIDELKKTAQNILG